MSLYYAFSNIHIENIEYFSLIFCFQLFLKMNTPLYGDSLEINDDECYSDDEETDIAPKIRLPEGNAAINAVARIMDGYGTDIPEHLLSEFVYGIKFIQYFKSAGIYPNDEEILRKRASER